MTAQIGILNKRAIVLATDSAVTIQSSQSDKKIYNSVNKLFALSKTKPIAVMIYGNAELLGAPWETMIKVYRKQFKSDYKKLDDYANNFIKWLEKEAKSLFSSKIQNHYFQNSVGSFYDSVILSSVKEKMQSMLNENGVIDEKLIIKFTKDKITEIHKALKAKNFINDCDQVYLDNLIKKHKKTIDKIIDQFFSKLSLKNPLKNKLIEIACYLFTKDVFSGHYSGVVMAGFGDDELYPALVEFQIEGVFENKIKFKRETVRDIKSDGCTARIIPFAQDDVIHNFLLGIHPANIKYFDEILKKYPSTITDNLETIPQKKKKELKKRIEKKNKEIFDKFIDETRKQFSDPIINMVGLMPITEMCDFAESLINLTSLRKKVTMQAETVGGETEVISITKGEGLIWIKRKHYFDPKLNPGFINNYLNI